MSNKPRFCPNCYRNLNSIPVKKEKQITGVKEVIHCPQCKTILNCDKQHVNVRCPICQRLFADVLTYIDHKGLSDTCV